MKTWFKIIGLIILFVLVGLQLVSGIIVITFIELLNLNVTQVEEDLMFDFVTFLCIIPLVLWRKRRLEEPIYLEKPKLSVILLTIPLAISLNFFDIFFMELLPLAEEGKELEELFAPYFEAPLWQSILFIAVFAALNEELLLRGLIYHELRRKTSVMVAVVIQAILFGILHMNLYQFIYTSISGIILGLLYVWTRSIWVAMSLHFVNNFFSLMMDRYTEYQPVGSVLYASICLIISLGFIFWIYRLQKGAKGVSS